jgi:hypothetical protein
MRVEVEIGWQFISLDGNFACWRRWAKETGERESVVLKSRECFFHKSQETFPQATNFFYSNLGLYPRSRAN